MLWTLPGGLATLDRLSRQVPARIGTISPMTAAIAEDGYYLRAIFGTAWALLPILGLLLAPIILISNHFHALPPSTPLFAAVMILGLLEPLAGLCCLAVIAIVLLLDGHLFSMGAIMGFAGLAVLWSILPTMIGKVRPLRRSVPTELDSWWLRVADHVIAPTLAFFFTSKFIESLPVLTGRAVPIVHAATPLAFIAAATVLLRLFLEDIATAWFPDRLAAVKSEIMHQLPKYTFVSALVRTGFFAAVIMTVIGLRWQSVLMIALYFAYSISSLTSKYLPRSTVVHRFGPNGLVKIAFMVIVGQAIAFGLAHLFHLAPIQLVADELLLVFVVVVVVKYLGNVSGEPWGRSWVTRAGGAVLALLTFLICFGVFHLPK